MSPLRRVQELNTWTRQHPVAAVLIFYFVTVIVAVAVSQVVTSGKLNNEANARSQQNRATTVENCKSQVVSREAIRKALTTEITTALANQAPFQFQHNAIIPDPYVDELNRQIAGTRTTMADRLRATQALIKTTLTGLPRIRCDANGKQIPVTPTTTTSPR